MTERIRVRFAPSPTGQLHIGNVRTAFFNWLFARNSGGDFILRIEDTDVERSSREYEKGILQDLSWLGLTWDEGPDKRGSYGPYRQSKRLELYREYASKLLGEGRAYYCFCTPEELKEKRHEALKTGKPPRYSGRCRNLPADKIKQFLKAERQAAIRFKVGEGTISFTDLVRGKITFNSKEIGDFIILRSDGIPPYNFAVVIDDTLMKVSCVIRGEDHISNTPKQILLYQALRFQPPKFAHLSMILGKDRTPLSKRHGDTSLSRYRENGFLSQAMRNYLALLGWSPPDDREILSTAEIIKEFSLNRVAKSAAIFDIEKLKWLNSHYIRKIDNTELVNHALPFLHRAEYIEREPEADVKDWLAEMINAVKDHISTLAELPKEAEIFFQFDAQVFTKKDEIKTMFSQDKAIRIIKRILASIEDEEKLSFEIFRKVAVSVGKELGCKGSQLYLPIRAALTGELSGPELNKIIPLLEKGKHLNLPQPIKGSAQRLKEFILQIKK